MRPVEHGLSADGWSSVLYARNQHEYLPLPALISLDGETISCWQLTWGERVRVFLTGKVWLTILTFNHPLQPVRLAASAPKFEAPHAD